MALEWNTWKHGGVVYPPPSATTNTLLLDLDKSLYYVLAFYESVLNTYLGPRFIAQAAAAGITVANAVVYTLPDNPTDYLTEQQVKFPLLAVYRVRTLRKDRTVTWRNNIQSWKVAYVLPTLTAGQREQLVPVLRAVEDVIDNRTEVGWDAGYLSGAQILGSSYANLETIEIKGAEYTAWEAGRDLIFPAIVLDLEVRERGVPIATAFDALEDVDINLDSVSEGQTTYASIVQTRTDTGALLEETDNLVARYKASTLVTYDGSNRVSQWNNIGGTGDAAKNLLQATGVRQPTYVAVDANFSNKPTILFMVNEFLRSGTWSASLSTPATIYVCAKPGSSSSARYILDGGIVTNRMALLTSDTTGYATMQSFTSLISTTNQAALKAIWCATFDSSASALYVNNMTTAAVAGDPGNQSLTQLIVGTAYIETLNTRGNIAEIIIYNTAHNETQRDLVYEYLAGEYGTPP